jgi:hypothetical protein
MLLSAMCAALSSDLSSPAFTLKGNYNCYKDHGATDLEASSGDPAGSMRLAACEAACVGHDKCSAIVIQFNTSDIDNPSCFRRADINIDKCDHNPTYGNYSLYEMAPDPSPPSPKTWSKTLNKNCYGYGHGGQDLEIPAGTSAGLMTLDACKDSCVGVSNCDGVVVTSRNGMYDCYRRGAIDPAKCDTNASYTLYTTKSYPPPPASPTPTPPAPAPAGWQLDVYPMPNPSWGPDQREYLVNVTQGSVVKQSFVYMSYPASDAPSAQQGKKATFTTFSFKGEVNVIVQKLNNPWKTKSKCTGDSSTHPCIHASTA